jgi:hypothetical protein
LGSITVTPASTTVAQGATKQFTAVARDQFGVALASQPAFAWAVTGSGTISTAGLYTAPAAGTPTDTVIATAAGGVSGSASVTVTLPSGDAFGQSSDVGSPGLAGSYSRAGSTYVVKGGGADIFNSSDQFHFVYRTLDGDGQIVARVVSVQNTNASAKAGVMFRESLNANSRHADLVISPDNVSRFQPRVATGGPTASYPLTGSTPPYWLKLVRSGNTITGYRSPDGVTWTAVEDQTYTALPTSMYVGLAVTAKDNTKLNTSSFDNVSVTAAGAGVTAAAAMTVIASRTTSPAHLVPASSAALDVLQVTQPSVLDKQRD